MITLLPKRDRKPQVREQVTWRRNKDGTVVVHIKHYKKGK